MTSEQIIYAILAIVLSAVITAGATVFIQMWTNTDSTKKHNAEKDEIRIQGEIKSLKDIIDKIEELLTEIREFIAVQQEKNNNNEKKFKAVWITISEIKQKNEDLSQDVKRNQQQIQELQGKQDKLTSASEKHNGLIEKLTETYDSVKNRVKELESV